ncbi:DUF1302 family protein [Solimonas sp. K1W22B-7]|uniref:DUF1302 family protein n=1 Tax=Solimonas sp. K1W22B-7 TaxID=2303331 RepID=UPI000E32E1DD|nr:DUF1302 family protein [Solimonas sp. K1W22B-7]AXQ28521.1 DUF1302 family protein [Solimonas sp. K1W22B-7]
MLNTTITITITFGAAVRTQTRSQDLVGNANLDANVCGLSPDGMILYQASKGLFRTQTFPAEHLVNAPGQFTLNADDGNPSYDKGGLAVVREGAS